MIYGNNPIGTVAYLGGLMSLPEAFCWSWGQMIQYNSESLDPGQYVHYDKATFSFHAYARNSLVDRFLGDWLLMLDADHSFEPDIVIRLMHRLNAHNLDVLTGIYMHKSPPYSPVLYHMNGDAIVPIGGWDPDGDMLEIGSAGGGCLMVRRRVFQQIDAELHEGPFDIEHPYGEDHSFFRRLKKLHVKAYCCPAIECYHLRAQAVALRDYRAEELTLERIQVGGQLCHDR